MQLKLKPAKGEHAGVSLTSGGSRAQLLHQGLTFSLLSLPFPLPVSSYLQVLLFFILASFSGSFPKAQQDSYQEFCTFLPPAKYPTRKWEGTATAAQQLSSVSSFFIQSVTPAHATHILGGTPPNLSAFGNTLKDSLRGVPPR